MAEPTTRFSGIKSAKWVTAGGDMVNNGTDLGELHEDSEVEYELPEEDKTTGDETPYAGEFHNATIKSFDMSKYAAVRTEYKADNRIDLQLTLQEGQTLLIENVLPRCVKDTRSGAVGGRNTWTLQPRSFSV